MYEEISEVDKRLILRLDLGGQTFCFDIIALRRQYQLAMETNKPIINPLDLHKRPIPQDKIKKIKKFWNKLVTTDKAFVQEQLVEYGYDPKKLSWPRKKTIKPIPKGWKLNWQDGGYLLASFYVSYNSKADPTDYFFPNLMTTNVKVTDPQGENYSPDTASTSDGAMWLIKELWDKQKLFKKLETQLQIIPSLKGIDKIKYWKLKYDHDEKRWEYTYQTFERWMKFLADLRKELGK
jgi:hypothetical protein